MPRNRQRASPHDAGGGRLIACLHAAIATTRFARLKLWAEAREAAARGEQYMKLLSAMEALLDDYSLRLFGQLRDWFEDANISIEKQETIVELVVSPPKTV
jgi:hypothetical protein